MSTKPEKAIYFFDDGTTSSFMSIVIGGIDVEVTLSDNELGIDHVEFYIGNVLKTSITS